MLVANAKRCLNIWSEVESGIFDESEFEQARNEFYEMVVRVVDSNPSKNFHDIRLPEIVRLSKIRTSKDDRMLRFKRLMISDADVLLKSGSIADVREAKQKLEKAEKAMEWIERPWSMFEVWSGKNGDVLKRLD
jgi:hypothetical protein